MAPASLNSESRSTKSGALETMAADAAADGADLLPVTKSRKERLGDSGADVPDSPPRSLLARLFVEEKN
jgi:hypothetical protein